MTREQIESALFQALGRVAPETDPRRVPKDEDLRDALDIDSMDFLAFVSALCRELGVEITERDYPRLHTIHSAVDFLSAKLG